MPTPVGPAPRDPEDPDLWEEWYTDDEGADEISFPVRRPVVRVVATCVVVALVILLVASRFA